MLAGAVLGARLGALALAVLLALVAVGLPLLSGGTGGLGVFLGPSAGYLAGWVLGAAAVGCIVPLGGRRPTAVGTAVDMLVGGIAVVYAVGIPVQSLVTRLPLAQTAYTSLVPPRRPAQGGHRHGHRDDAGARLPARVPPRVGLDHGAAGRRRVDGPVTPPEGVDTAALRLVDVGVRLGDVDALRDVTLEMDARTVAVIGENGSGKSTFARLVGGLVGRTTGELRVLGVDPDRGSRELRRRVALVFSNPDAQIVMPTVAEDVAFSLRPERLSRAESDARVSECLRRFGIQHLADRSSHELSGGQKQLLALAGAFVRRPELVIADEPTADLDARNARRVADHLFEDGHRLVLVTHDLAAAARCEAAVLFAGGRLVRTGGPADVIAEYEAMLG